MNKLVAKGKKTIVFCGTNDKVKKLVKLLIRIGLPKVKGIHGGQPQVTRESTLDNFKKNVFSVIISTDIILRGLDLKGITDVVN